MFVVGLQPMSAMPEYCVPSNSKYLMNTILACSGNRIIEPNIGYTPLSCYDSRWAVNTTININTRPLQCYMKVNSFTYLNSWRKWLIGMQLYHSYSSTMRALLMEMITRRQEVIFISLWLTYFYLVLPWNIINVNNSRNSRQIPLKVKYDWLTLMPLWRRFDDSSLIVTAAVNK